MMVNNRFTGLLGLYTIWYSEQHPKPCFGNWICFCPQVREWDAFTTLHMLGGANLNPRTCDYQHHSFHALMATNCWYQFSSWLATTQGQGQCFQNFRCTSFIWDLKMGCMFLEMQATLSTSTWNKSTRTK
jgi:hypothetical protein